MVPLLLKVIYNHKHKIKHVWKSVVCTDLISHFPVDEHLGCLQCFTNKTSLSQVLMSPVDSPA